MFCHSFCRFLNIVTPIDITLLEISPRVQNFAFPSIQYTPYRFFLLVDWITLSLWTIWSCVILIPIGLCRTLTKNKKTDSKFERGLLMMLKMQYLPLKITGSINSTDVTMTGTIHITEIQRQLKRSLSRQLDVKCNGNKHFIK